MALLLSWSGPATAVGIWLMQIVLCMRACSRTCMVWCLIEEDNQAGGYSCSGLIMNSHDDHEFVLIGICLSVWRLLGVKEQDARYKIHASITRTGTMVRMYEYVNPKWLKK